MWKEPGWAVFTMARLQGWADLTILKKIKIRPGNDAERVDEIPILAAISGGDIWIEGTAQLLALTVHSLIGGPCAALFLTESVTGAKLNVSRAVDQAEAILLEVMKRAKEIHDENP